MQKPNTSLIFLQNSQTFFDLFLQPFFFVYLGDFINQQKKIDVNEKNNHFDFCTCIRHFC